MKIRIKYFEEARKLEKISKGNWIDVYANKDVFVPVNEREMIPLGFALELPQGWEGHLAPRSSTFKTWGIIQTNSVGVVDDTYIGDNDQWHMPVYCLQGKDNEKNGTWTNVSNTSLYFLSIVSVSAAKTLSPTSMSSIFFNPSIVNTKVPATKHFIVVVIPPVNTASADTLI